MTLPAPAQIHGPRVASPCGSETCVEETKRERYMHFREPRGPALAVLSTAHTDQGVGMSLRRFVIPLTLLVSLAAAVSSCSDPSPVGVDIQTRTLQAAEAPFKPNAPS